MHDTGASNWIWVRHGPTAATGRFCGQSNPGLDDAANADYQALAQALPQGCRVFTSPLIRATGTLEKLRAFGFQPHTVDTSDLLMEQHFGACEDQPYHGTRLPDGAEALAAWQPPGGESFAMMAARINAFIQQMHTGQNISVMCHAGPIRAALATVLDIAPSRVLGFAIEPLSRTAMTRLASGHWQISYINRIGAQP